MSVSPATSSAARLVAQVGLIALMLACGLMMWLGSPVLWLWVGAQLTNSQQPQLGPYMVVAIGILATTIALVYALSRLNRAYENLIGGQRTVRVRVPWMRNFSEHHQPTELTVFDAVLVFTALTALVAFVAWFFFVAGSPLPKA